MCFAVARPTAEQTSCAWALREARPLICIATLSPDEASRRSDERRRGVLRDADQPQLQLIAPGDLIATGRERGAHR